MMVPFPPFCPPTTIARLIYTVHFWPARYRMYSVPKFCLFCSIFFLFHILSSLKSLYSVLIILIFKRQRFDHCGILCVQFHFFFFFFGVPIFSGRVGSPEDVIRALLCMRSSVTHCPIYNVLSTSQAIKAVRLLFFIVVYIFLLDKSKYWISL